MKFRNFILFIITPFDVLVATLKPQLTKCLFIILFLSGCGIVTSVDDDNKESKILSVDQRISTKEGLLSLMAPIHKDIGVFYGVYKVEEGMALTWAVKNMMASKLIISTEAYPGHTFESAKYLNPKNLKIFEEETKTKESFYNTTTSAIYKKAYLDYIDGVKCRTFVHADLRQIYQNVIDGEKTYTQYYDTYCSFYQPKNIKKPTNMVRLQYEYSFNSKSKAFTDSNKTEQEVLNDIHNIFRQDIQAIFSTIKLGMDREKMRKEGLLFDKPYRVQF